LRNLEFDPSAFEDRAWWVEKDRAQALRIIRLVRDIQRDPYAGLGKPGPLKHEFSACWSRRVNEELGLKDFQPCGRAPVLGITLVAAFARGAACRKPIAES
jgi:toxin YoeB